MAWQLPAKPEPVLSLPIQSCAPKQAEPAKPATVAPKPMPVHAEARAMDWMVVSASILFLFIMVRMYLRRSTRGGSNV